MGRPCDRRVVAPLAEGLSALLGRSPYAARTLVLVGVLSLGAGLSPARGDLGGLPARPPALSAGEMGVLADNPDLASLNDTSPWTLRAVLDALASLPPGAAGNADPDRIKGMDRQLLDRNSALTRIYRASPEAALELLALIKAAGGGKKGE